MAWPKPPDEELSIAGAFQRRPPALPRAFPSWCNRRNIIIAFIAGLPHEAIPVSQLESGVHLPASILAYAPLPGTISEAPAALLRLQGERAGKDIEWPRNGANRQKDAMSVQKTISALR